MSIKVVQPSPRHGALPGDIWFISIGPLWTELCMRACTVHFRGTTGLVTTYAQRSYVRISRAGHLLSPFCHLACKLEWHAEWVPQMSSTMSDRDASLHSSLSGYYGSGNHVCAAVVRQNQSGGSPVVTILPSSMQTWMACRMGTTDE